MSNYTKCICSAKKQQQLPNDELSVEMKDLITKQLQISYKKPIYHFRQDLNKYQPNKHKPNQHNQHKPNKHNQHKPNKHNQNQKEIELIELNVLEQQVHVYIHQKLRTISEALRQGENFNIAKDIQENYCKKVLIPTFETLNTQKQEETTDAIELENLNYIESYNCPSILLKSESHYLDQQQRAKKFHDFDMSVRDFWKQTVDQLKGKNYFQMDEKFKLQVQKSITKEEIPQQYRQKLWRKFVGNRLNISKEYYQQQLNLISQKKIQVEQRIKRIVKSDIIRSFPDFKAFRNQTEHYKEIKQLLYCYCIFNQEIEYTQSMSYLAILIYLYIQQKRRFIVFANLINNNRMIYDHFQMDHIKVQNYQKAFEMILNSFHPCLVEHFREQQIYTDLYLLDWFMTFFVRVFNIQHVAYILDRFIIEGEQILFKVGLSLLAVNSKLFMSKPFEDICMILKNRTFDHDFNKVRVRIDDYKTINNRYIQFVIDHMIHQ